MLDYAQLQDNAEQAVSLLKAVGNKHRLMILCILQEGELSVSELNQRIPMPQSTLSQHLSSLRKDKIVSTRRAAQTIYYSLNNANVVELIALLHKLYCK
nr:metalloregulator ArsR/SmtB family transcription factor [Vibrio marisflavi]